MQMMRNKNRGFTLFELLLTMAAFAIILSFAFPFSNSSVVSGNLDVATRSVESALHRAYVYARSGENDSDWGVHIVNTNPVKSAIVFPGSDYVTHDSGLELDEISDISTAISLGGDTDIIFTKSSGVPVSAGSITLSANQVTKTITINELGAISVN